MADKQHPLPMMQMAGKQHPLPMIEQYDLWESDPEAAYAEAVRRVEQALAEGDKTLDLAYLRALRRLPKTLAELTGVQSLNLNRTQVTDISPLVGLTQLRSLYLGETQVTDISPLAELTGLQRLYLNGTQLTDINPLAKLKQLQKLYLERTQVTDISPLAELTQLQTLYLNETKITNISLLAGLTQLQKLYLGGTQVTDISPLAGLTQLQDLNFYGTQVADISPLAGLTQLQRLYLGETQVTDISPLAGLTGVQSLDLNGTQVADLRPLRGLTGLANDFQFNRLHFERTLAAQKDPKLIQISAINGNVKRVEALFAYLDTLLPWPEPLEKDEEKTPTQNPRFYAKVRDNVDIYPEKSTEEEVSDPIKQALHKKLRASIDVLERYGNRIDYIGDFARSMRRFLGETLAQTEMLMLHMEVETAKFHLEGEIEESDIVVALKEITRFGPALTLDNPGVMELDERTKRAEGESQSDNFTDIEVFARIMQENPKIFGEMLRIISGNIRQISESDQPQIPSDIRITYDVGNNSIRNTLIAIGAFMFATPTEGTIATELARFMIDNTQVFKNAAAAYGGSFKEWYDTVFVSVQTYFDKQ